MLLDGTAGLSLPCASVLDDAGVVDYAEEGVHVCIPGLVDCQHSTYSTGHVYVAIGGNVGCTL
jgi:hypothetical protein